MVLCMAITSSANEIHLRCGQCYVHAQKCDMHATTVLFEETSIGYFPLTNTETSSIAGSWSLKTRFALCLVSYQGCSHLRTLIVCGIEGGGLEDLGTCGDGG